MTTQAVVLEMFISGAWTAIPLHASEGSTITRGVDAGGSWPRPGKIEATINNDTLAYDPSRPESSLYGVAGRNVKTRISVGGSTRLWAEASEFRPERTTEHVASSGRGRAEVGLTAEGVLRRLGKWTDPLRSPMYRTISGRSTSIGHWSLEDDRDALTLANSSDLGKSGTFKGGLTLGESDTPLGAEQTVKIADGSQMTGRFDSASTTAGWQFAFSMHLPALPPSATYVNFMYWTASNGYTWYWDVNNTTYRINVRDADGTLIYTVNVSFGAGAEPNKWVTFRLKASASGGTVTLEPAWYAQGMTTSLGITDTFAGTVGALRTWVQQGNATTAGGWFSHIFAVTGVADSLVGAAAQKVFNGYVGETAMARYARLCLELGITRYILTDSGSSAETVPMGPQKAATFLDLLKECMVTEDGIIYDERADAPALTMRSRRDMYAQAAALTLTYPGDVAPPLQKVIGDEGTRNRVTVKNAFGGELTVSQTTGPMSVSPPPAGVGEYKETVDVNVDTESTNLPLRASWELAKGTLERPRYETVTVDLLANPGLVAAAIAVNEGDRIDIAGFEPDPIMLRVVGYLEKIGKTTRTLTFAVEPYEPYDVGIWDDATFRWDARTSTLVGAESTSDTSWAIQCTDPGDVWTTAGGSFPFDWKVAGERVRVTAMTAPAGTGPYTQTATVTRSINGVVKAHTAGTSIGLADPKRWGY